MKYNEILDIRTIYWWQLNAKTMFCVMFIMLYKRNKNVQECSFDTVRVLLCRRLSLLTATKTHPLL